MSDKIQTNTIILTGGGSGGHIAPLLPLARELKEKNNCTVIYIGLKGDKLEGLEQRYQVFDKVYTVPAGKFRRYYGESIFAHLIDVKTLVLNFRDFFRVVSGIFASRRLLRKLKPQVVFSKGGYAAVPVGIAAHRLHIPIVTHDSDAVAGLANRIIGRWATLHATGMPVDNYNYPKETTRYVGIPIDERIRPVKKAKLADFKRQIGFSADSLVLLVAGGGLGARSLNNKLIKVAPQLFAAFPKLRMVHLSGKRHEQDVTEGYASSLGSDTTKHVSVIGFTDEFYRYSGAADLVVTRAGATVLAEFAAQGKACIVVPSPFLAGGHQLKNAEALSRLKAIRVVADDAPASTLREVVVNLLGDERKRSLYAQRLGAMARNDAASELAELILEVAGLKDGRRHGT